MGADATTTKGGHRLPRQERSRETYEKLLEAAQQILESGGLEALNTNAIAANAGVSPAAFYRYFPDKYGLLDVLGTRLMDAQNAALLNPGDTFPTDSDSLLVAVRQTLHDTLAVTRSFLGGQQLLISLRAIPALHHIRLDSHTTTARVLARLFSQNFDGLDDTELLVRCRLMVDTGYAAVEMLFDTDFAHADVVLQRAAMASLAIMGVGTDVTER